MWHGGMLDQCPGLPWAAGAPLKLATLSFTSKLVLRLQTLSIFTAPVIAELSLSGTASSVCPPLLLSEEQPLLLTKGRMQCNVARPGHAYIESQA